MPPRIIVRFFLQDFSKSRAFSSFERSSIIPRPPFLGRRVLRSELFCDFGSSDLELSLQAAAQLDLDDVCSGTISTRDLRHAAHRRPDQITKQYISFSKKRLQGFLLFVVDP
jgi:hypothetical protein